MPTVALLTTISANQSLAALLQALGEGFRALGFETLSLGGLTGDMTVAEATAAANRRDCAFLVTVNGFSADYAMQRPGWLEAFRAPSVEIVVDNPWSIWPRMTQAVPNRLLFHCDREMAGFLKRYAFAEETHWLPHVAMGDAEDSPRWAGRSIDVLVPGMVEQLESGWPEAAPKATRCMIERWRARPTLGMAEHMRGTVAELGHSHFDAMLLDILDTSSHAERWVRSQTRIDVLAALGKAGVRCTLVGDWSALPTEVAAMHEIRAPLPLLEVLTLMRDAKFVLSTSPSLPHAGHERAFSAMVAGAVAVVDENPFWRSTFGAKGCLAFDLWHPQQLSNQMRWLIERPAQAQKIADAGRKQALQNFSPTVAAKRILDVVTAHKRRRLDAGWAVAG